jgi:Cys-tRNA(Pro)/Cys-tRNA(Cys) deacylase
MTPAIQLARKSKIEHSIHDYEHDPGHESYGLEAAEKLGLDPAEVFKTLVVKLDGARLACAVLPVSRQLNMKRMAKAAKAKKAEMADAASVQRSSGYVLGGVSPLAQKKALPTVIDASAENLPKMYVSAGKRGMDMGLQPADLQRLTRAVFADISE